MAGGVVKGIPLAAIWCIEAAVIVVGSGFISWIPISSTPFCENAMCWLDDEEVIDTLAIIQTVEDRELLENGDLAPLSRIMPRSETAQVWTRLTLRSSPQSEYLMTLTVSDANIKINDEGEAETEAFDVISNLMINRELFDLVGRYRDIQPVKSTADSELDDLEQDDPSIACENIQ